MLLQEDEKWGFSKEAKHQWLVFVVFYFCFWPDHFTDSPQLLLHLRVSMLCHSGDGFEPPCLGPEPTPLTHRTGEIVFHPHPPGLKLQLWCLGSRNNSQWLEDARIVGNFGQKYGNSYMRTIMGIVIIRIWNYGIHVDFYWEAKRAGTNGDRLYHNLSLF
jgi:hypothetical protein